MSGARADGGSGAQFLKEHGGILYAREFYDARQPPAEKQASVGSWQDKCSLPETAGREEAEAFFAEMGFTAEQMEWREDGGLRLTNAHPGTVKDPETGDDVWWNIAHTGRSLPRGVCVCARATCLVVCVCVCARALPG